MLTGTFSGLTTVGSFGQAQVSLSYDSHDVFLTIAAPPVTVIESYGSTSLVQVGNNYFLYPVGGSSGPELSVWGAPVVAGQFGSTTVIGAERTASGYDVAWKTGAGQYSIWGTDSNGNYVGNVLDAPSGSSSALQSIEPVFHQDLNGDGLIGPPPPPPPTVIEAYGSTDLDQVASNYFLYVHGTSSGPELMLGGAAVMAGQFGSWAPIGAERTASGYDVAWKNCPVPSPNDHKRRSSVSLGCFGKVSASDGSASPFTPATRPCVAK